MAKGLLILIFIGVLGIFFIKNFVGEIQKNDATYQTAEAINNKADQMYYRTDGSGRIAIDVSSLNATGQYELWNRSHIKQELISNMPNFKDMEDYAKETIYGSPLQDDVLKAIADIRKSMLSGSMTQIEAQRLLDLK